MPMMDRKQVLADAADSYRSGDLVKSQTLYQSLLGHDLPEDAEARHGLGLAMMAAGNLAEGVASLKAALVSDPHNKQYWLSMAAAFLTMGQPGPAKGVLDKAAEFGIAGPDVAAMKERLHEAERLATLVGSGLEHVRSGRLGQAYDLLAQALQIDPHHQAAFRQLVSLALDSTLPPPAHVRSAIGRGYRHIHRMQVEITTACNLRCAECPRTVALAKKQWTSRHMSLENFDRMIAHLPPAHVLCLQGVGEPTLHPHLTKMIARARSSEKFKMIVFNTNALAKDPLYYDELHQMGLTNISVSIDSLSPEIAERCRARTDANKLEQNLLVLLNIFPNLCVTIVASRLNLSDIGTTIRRLSAIGVRSVEIQPLIDYRQPEATTALGPADADDLLARIESSRGSVNVIIPPSLLQQGSGRCVRPFFAPYVTVDGYLTPCCTVYDPGVLGRANIFEEPFMDLLSRPAVAEFFDKYVDEEPAFCVGCCFRGGKLRHG